MKIVNEVPDLKEYVDLRLAAGMESAEEETLKNGLMHSLCTVSARGDQDELLGMGRIIGDGGVYYQIVDLIVSPVQDEQGLQEAILNQLLDYLETHASKDAQLMVVSDVAGIKLYQKHGFKLVYPEFYGLTRSV
ncbi:GNAT family N-acetyltransferase [Paenibacillus dokdonensis]|uniref:GNAT family N-acetyltransferase n=1 Tax=Paenibacillus dokdonensis TaxID=2567944 RepID=A0ABU6GRV5_9BACL|nr:GNAT family N-acetyltransferase [Paenibacillus dokdonensis]MEC0242494.1 GNAT family N-acetyltransferase [Paenibacillus dokdonensis]